MDFSTSSFWVRIFGVPLTMRNKPNCELIGVLIVNLQEVDVGEDGGHTSI